MNANYLAVADLAVSTTFRTRLMVAMAMTASSIVVENTDALGEQQAIKRSDLARQILSNPASWIDRFIWPIVVAWNIKDVGVAATDEDIAGAVAANWDLVANVLPSDKLPEDAPE